MFCLLDLTVVKTVHCSTDDDEEDIMIDDETTPSNHSGEWVRYITCGSFCEQRKNVNNHSVKN